MKNNPVVLLIISLLLILLFLNYKVIKFLIFSWRNPEESLFRMRENGLRARLVRDPGYNIASFTNLDTPKDLKISVIFWTIEILILNIIALPFIFGFLLSVF